MKHGRTAVGRHRVTGQTISEYAVVAAALAGIWVLAQTLVSDIHTHQNNYVGTIAQP